jgi:hypothetical protein
MPCQATHITFGVCRSPRDSPKKRCGRFSLCSVDVTRESSTPEEPPASHSGAVGTKSWMYIRPPTMTDEAVAQWKRQRCDSGRPVSSMRLEV